MINYTLKQLYSFEAVVRLGSFTKASKELNITQPAVYMQIQQLKQNINSEIINVNGKKVSTTFIGKKLYKTSLDVIHLLEQASSEIEHALNPETGHLQIAVATTANSFVSRLLSNFKLQYPKMSFHLEVTNRKTLLEKIENKEADLIIMGEPPKDIDLPAHAFMENPLIAIVHPDHRLLSNANNTINDLKKEILITREQGSGTRMTIERFTGLNFNSNIEINSNEAIIEAVQAGLGIGFVSEHTVKLELKNNIIKKLEVSKFPIVRHWHVVHHSSRKLSPIAKDFRQFIIDENNH
ncbi:MAG: LysR family transcriptional regulator [PS1 clade bacterium]|jgi:DNA-binding transcriptional LysR family regulator